MHSAGLPWALSIRTRLTLWYTAALAVLLVLMTLATYGMLTRTTQSDADAYLTNAADEVAESLQIALSSVPQALQSDTAATRWAAERTLDNHRFRDIGVAIFRARTATASDPRQLLLLAVDTTASATREFGGAAGWLRASQSATQALALMETDLMTIGPHGDRVVSMPVLTRRGTFVVALSQSTERRDATLQRVREAMYIGVPMALLLAMAGGFLLAAASLRPVEVMRVTAERIGARTLHERLPVSRPPDELSRLSQTLNALLDRVEDAFEQRRRFTADASHELRTPVSIVIGESELALATERSPHEYRAALGVIYGEARRLALIVEDLFLLARGDAAEQSLVPTALYVEEMVGDCIDAMGTIARAKQITLCFSPESEVPYTGDDAMLRRLMMNLLDNAIKYTPVGGTVTAEAVPQTGGGAVIRVSDTGIGVAPEHQSHIFERFYRVQHTTPRTGLADATGAGLGLPIASWIAKAHGGSLALAESNERGSTFEVRLPPYRLQLG
jgi:heavy metal sensor kinase